jgi:hypothetical protein
MPVLHTSAIVLHALSATGAFLVGIVLLFESNTHRQLQLAKAVLVLLILMAVFLVIAILSHFSSLPTIKLLIFGGLFILLMYMIWRAIQAITVLTKQQPEDQLKVIDHIGFVLISLFDGLVIVSALDLQAPGWLIAVVAVGGVALGIFGITVRKKALAMQSKRVEVQGD